MHEGHLNEDSGLNLLGLDAERAARSAAGASQTDWAVIFEAASGEEGAAEALTRLAHRYWPAIYAYIRASGRDTHEAADLTQGFVCDVILQRGLLAAADPARGRFRTLLMTSLKNYLREQHRRSRRLKRSDKGSPPLQLDPDDLARAAVDPASNPEEAFSAEWSRTLISQVLDQVRAECEAAGQMTHWQVFEERVARPMLTGQGPTEYEDLIRRLKLRDASQAANLVITVKRRVVRGLIEEVRHTVQHPDQIQEELQELMRSLEPRS